MKSRGVNNENLNRFSVTVIKYVIILCPADEIIEIWWPSFDQELALSLLGVPLPKFENPIVPHSTAFTLKPKGLCGPHPSVSIRTRSTKGDDILKTALHSLEEHSPGIEINLIKLNANYHDQINHNHIYHSITHQFIISFSRHLNLEQPI